LPRRSFRKKRARLFADEDDGEETDAKKPAISSAADVSAVVDPQRDEQQQL